MLFISQIYILPVSRNIHVFQKARAEFKYSVREFGELGFERAFERLRRQFSTSSVTRITSQQKHAPNPEPGSHDAV